MESGRRRANRHASRMKALSIRHRGRPRNGGRRPVPSRWRGHGFSHMRNAHPPTPDDAEAIPRLHAPSRPLTIFAPPCYTRWQASEGGNSAYLVSMESGRRASLDPPSRQDRRDAAMPDRFDPYHQWLGIPPKDQPPNHYRLLGVSLSGCGDTGCGFMVGLGPRRAGPRSSCEERAPACAGRRGTGAGGRAPWQDSTMGGRSVR